MNTEAFLLSLKIMGMGMLGIFIVTLVIIGAILLFNLVANRKPKSDEAEK